MALDIQLNLSATALAALLAMKLIACMTSLGSGFRGENIRSANDVGWTKDLTSAG